MRISASIFFLLIVFVGSAQNMRQYDVFFTDKDQIAFSLSQPTDFLSQRAVDRRLKQSIIIDSTDLPIPNDYLVELRNIKSLNILSTSKWFNDAVIGITDTSVLEKIRQLPFVRSVVALPASFTKTKATKNEKLNVISYAQEFGSSEQIYGLALRQISMLNADFMHNRGYKGKGMRIAVIDAGYSNVSFSPHFTRLVGEGRIIDVYDFINNNDSVYNYSIHGNRVLSTMAAYSPNSMIGTAPEAEYLLLRSEDAADEYLLEEYYWTEAAEFADSAGSDIINTSLGYSTFDDTLQNHTYGDMDGLTTRISVSASIAANKGMLVFNSAGNSGANSWGKITTPGDAFDILTIGAVDSSGEVANFSSRGPTSDGRVKPEVMAMGQKVYVGLDDGSVAASNGTSFSSPIMAGAAACLWQANATKTWHEVKEAIVKSANRYAVPDSNYGFGLPDFYIADAILKGVSNYDKLGEASVKVYPNPFSDELFVTFRLKNKQRVKLELIHSSGKVVKKMNYVEGGEQTSIIYLQESLQDLAPSMYFLKIYVDGFSKEMRIIKE